MREGQDCCAESENGSGGARNWTCSKQREYPTAGGGDGMPMPATGSVVLETWDKEDADYKKKIRGKEKGRRRC